MDILYICTKEIIIGIETITRRIKTRLIKTRQLKSVGELKMDKFNADIIIKL